MPSRPARAVPAPPEREVLRGILAAAQALGLKLERQNTGAARYPNADGSTRLVRYGAKGQLDLGGLLDGGRHIEVEAKRKGKRPTPEQLARMRAINAGGGVAFWADDAAEAARVLRLVMGGARVEVDGKGGQWVVTPEGAEVGNQTGGQRDGVE